jgi:hypothetical protein
VSIEHDLRLSATCSPLGAVTFTVDIVGLQHSPEEWRVSASLVTEFGQLQNLSARAKQFFGGT